MPGGSNPPGELRRRRSRRGGPLAPQAAPRSPGSADWRSARARPMAPSSSSYWRRVADSPGGVRPSYYVSDASYRGARLIRSAAHQAPRRHSAAPRWAAWPDSATSRHGLTAETTDVAAVLQLAHEAVIIEVARAYFERVGVLGRQLVQHALDARCIRVRDGRGVLYAVDLVGVFQHVGVVRLQVLAVQVQRERLVGTHAMYAGDDASHVAADHVGALGHQSTARADARVE